MMADMHLDPTHVDKVARLFDEIEGAEEKRDSPSGKDNARL